MGHGACLGLGLAAMGTGNYDIYDLLKENLMTRDDAVIGEAAGLAMGLVMIGTKSEDALEDMLNVSTCTEYTVELLSNLGHYWVRLKCPG